MARLAGDIDFCPRGAVAAARASVVLLQAGGVALRTLQVPVLRPPRPVQLVGVRHPLVRIQMEPAPATALRWARVPGDPERLQSSSRDLDEVLLQRRGTEGVADRVVVQRAVRPVRPHPEEIPIAEET